MIRKHRCKVVPHSGNGSTFAGPCQLRPGRLPLIGPIERRVAGQTNDLDLGRLQRSLLRTPSASTGSTTRSAEESGDDHWSDREIAIALGPKVRWWDNGLHAVKVGMAVAAPSAVDLEARSRGRSARPLTQRGAKVVRLSSAPSAVRLVRSRRRVEGPLSQADEVRREGGWPGTESWPLAPTRRRPVRR